jgi:hypothetical protein
MIEKFHSIATAETNVKDILWDVSRFLPVVSSTEFNHHFRLFFFANQIWQKHFAERQNIGFIENPFILCFPFWIFTAFSAVKQSTENRMKPVHQSLIGVYNQNTAIKSPFLIAMSSDIKSAFSINDSRKITNLLFVPHIPTPIVSLRLTLEGINSKLPAETNPRGTRKSEVIVRPATKVAEAIRNELLAA